MTIPLIPDLSLYLSRVSTIQCLNEILGRDDPRSRVREVILGPESLSSDSSQDRHTLQLIQGIGETLKKKVTFYFLTYSDRRNTTTKH